MCYTSLLKIGPELDLRKNILSASESSNATLTYAALLY